MAFTKVAAAGITTSGGYTVQDLSAVGVVTASSFVGALTGNVTGTATTATSLSNTPNIVVGVVTASSFVGALTGNVTGNVTGTATTATSLSNTPNIVVGVVTAVSAEFSGNISVGGTLTYEDVTNVDSVGLITARSGIHVTGGSVGIGTDNPISELMVENATQSHITVKTSGSNMAKFGSKGNDVYIGGTAGAANIIFKRNIVSTDHPADSGTETVRITSNGNVGINTNNPGTELHVQGTNGYAELRLSGNSGSGGSLEYYDATTKLADIYADSSSNLIFRNTASNTQRLRITSDGNVGIGSDNPQAKLDVAGEIRASGIAITESYPTIRPSLNLNFANSRSLDPRITFTRASVGTYVGRDGLIKTAGEDEARFDHDPETLESLGLLIEEQRTNIWNDSADLTISNGPVYSNWDNASRTANVATAPDGTTAADRNTFANATSTTLRRVSTTAGTTYTFSIYLKKDPTSTDTLLDYFGFIVCWSNNGTTLTGYAFPNLVNGQNASDVLTDEWKRFSFSYIAPAGSVSMEFGISNRGAGTNTLTTPYSVLCWGAQIEAGSFPTSLIPTSGAAVTRAEERALINQQIASGDITICAEYKVRITTSNQWNRLFGFGEGNSDVRPFINSNGDIIWYNYSTNDPVTDWSALGLSVPDNSYFRFAFAIRQNVANSVSVNGTSVNTQTSTNPGAYVNWNELYLGWSDIGTGPRDITGHIKEFRIYNDAFTDTQLQLLSK